MIKSITFIIVLWLSIFFAWMWISSMINSLIIFKEFKTYDTIPIAKLKLLYILVDSLLWSIFIFIIN
jgi:hypothetical protein